MKIAASILCTNSRALTPSCSCVPLIVIWFRRGRDWSRRCRIWRNSFYVAYAWSGRETSPSSVATEPARTALRAVSISKMNLLSPFLAVYLSIRICGVCRSSLAFWILLLVCTLSAFPTLLGLSRISLNWLIFRT